MTDSIPTLKDMDVLEPGEKSGAYKLIKQKLDNPKIVCLLVAAILKCSDSEYLTWEQIIHHPVLFPFEITGVTQADMPTCERLVLERMGDNVVIRFK